MGALGELHIDISVTNFDSTATFDEVPENLWCIAVFKTTQLLGETAIKSIRYHSHDHIKMDLDQDR